MSNKFWQRRVAGLKRPRKSPAYRVLAMREDGTTVLTPDTGEIIHGALGDTADILSELFDAGVERVITMDPGTRLLYTFTTTGTATELLHRGYMLRPFETGRHTGGIIMSRTVEQPKRGEPQLAIFDIGPYFPDVNPTARGTDAVMVINEYWDQLVWLCETFYGTAPEMTPARTGFMAWRRTMRGPMWRKPKASRRHARLAFHGGYTRAFHTGQIFHNAKQYDLNSAYVWAMGQGVPIGSPVWFEGDIPDTFVGLPGIVEADILVAPRSIGVALFPGLRDDRPPRPEDREPMVREDGAYRFTVWITTQELSLSERDGALCVVLRGWVWPDGIGHPFDAVVMNFERARNAAREFGKPLEGAAKLIQNATWGGLAKRAVQPEILLAEDQPDESWHPYFAGSGLIHGAWIREYDADDVPQQQVAIAAWLTATVRCRLVETIMDIGMEHVAYVDTDCIIVDESVTLPTGDRYGDWKLERTYDVFRAFAGKRYEGITTTGENVLRLAGIQSGTATGDDVAAMYGLEPLASARSGTIGTRASAHGAGRTGGNGDTSPRSTSP